MMVCVVGGGYDSCSNIDCTKPLIMISIWTFSPLESPLDCGSVCALRGGHSCQAIASDKGGSSRVFPLEHVIAG